jgi:hypothetical protein
MDKIHINWLDDMHLENKILFSQFYQAMKNNDINTASDILINNPQLSNQIIDADNINQLITAIVTLESQPKIDIDNFLNNLQIIFQNLINQTKFISAYNNMIQYEKQNFVTYNGMTYFAIMTPPIGTIPTNTSYWNEYNVKGLQGYPGLGLNLRYNWSATINYSAGDVAVYQNKLWAAIADNINTPPNLMFQDWFIIGLPKLPIKTSITTTAPANISVGDLWFKVTSGGSVIQTKWEYKANMPTTRYACRCFINGTNIYSLGGDDITAERIATNEMYDTVTNTWSTKQPMITPRGGLMTFTLGTKGYACGGTHIFGDVLDICEEYDFTLNTWSSKAPIPQPLVTSGYATNGAKTVGYLFGGGATGYISINTIYKYTQATNTWAVVGVMPEASQSVQAYNLGDIVYIMYSADNSPICKFYTYNIGTQVWTAKTNLLEYRNYPTMVADGNNVYCIGGINIDGYTTNTNQIYDITNNTWKYGIPMQTTRISAGIATIGGKIYVMGGADLAMYEVTNTLEVYTI